MYLNKFSLVRCRVLALPVCLGIWLSGCALKERLETQQPEPVQPEITAQAIQDRKLFADALARSRPADASEQTLQAALESFEQLYQGNPNYLGALANAADINFRLQRFEQAEQKYSLLLEQSLNPPAQAVNEPETALQEQAQAVTEQTQEANETGDPASKSEPEIKVNFAVHSLNQLGLLARQQGQFEQAESYYRRALELAPEQPEVIRNLAILLDLYRGQLAEALALYKQYQSLQPEADSQVKDWIFDLQNRLPAEAANE